MDIFSLAQCQGGTQLFSGLSLRRNCSVGSCISTGRGKFSRFSISIQYIHIQYIHGKRGVQKPPLYHLVLTSESLFAYCLTSVSCHDGTFINKPASIYSWSNQPLTAHSVYSQLCVGHWRLGNTKTRSWTSSNYWELKYIGLQCIMFMPQ